MEQSQGGIEIHSELGVEATIVLYFRPDNGDEAKTVAKSTVPKQETSPARILLVEDEPAVLRVLKTILTNARYGVVTALSGGEAVEIFEKDDKFDLVVTDIVMAGNLQGNTMAQHIRLTHPVQSSFS